MKNLLKYFLPLLFLSCVKTYIIDISSGPGGTVSTFGGEIQEGESLVVTAIPDDEYYFKSWSDGSTQNPRTIIVNSSLTIQAIFSKVEYSVNLSSIGEGVVQEELISGSGEYESGSVIRLTGVPSNGWIFKSWNINGVSFSENPKEVVVDSEKSITAIFEREKYEVQLIIEGEGSVNQQIISRPSLYEYETEVEFTAVPSEGWEFSRWEGPIESTENPITLVVDEGIQLKAFFKRVDFLVQISKIGEGNISEELVMSPGQYPFESQIRLTASPEVNWFFNGWSGDVNSNENPLDVLIDSNKSITGEFIETFELNIEKSGEGTVEINLLEGTKVENRYTNGSKLEIKAIPDDSWRFIEWSDYEDIESTIIIEMTQNLTLSPKFLEEFDLLVNTGDGGTYDMEIVSGNSDFPFLDGNIVRLTAVSNTDHLFYNWSGDISSEDRIIEFEINKDYNLEISHKNISEVITFNDVEISNLYSDSVNLTTGIEILDDTYPLVEWGFKIEEINGDFVNTYYPNLNDTFEVSISELPKHFVDYQFTIVYKFRDQSFMVNEGTFKTTFYKPSEISISDIDGNDYSFIKLDNDFWSTTNLNVTKFRNGDELVTHSSLEDFAQNYDASQPTYIDVSFDSENGTIYGKLYNLRALTDPRTIVPEGTRIPEYGDIDNLLNWMVGKSMSGTITDVAQYFKHPDGGFGNNSPKTNETNLGFKGIGISNENYRLALKSIWSAATREAKLLYFDESNSIQIWDRQDFWSSKTSNTRLQLINPYSYRSFYFIRVIAN